MTSPQARRVTGASPASAGDQELYMLLTLSSGRVSGPAMNAAEAIIGLIRENQALGCENAYLHRRVMAEEGRIVPYAGRGSLASRRPSRAIVSWSFSRDLYRQ